MRLGEIWALRAALFMGQDPFCGSVILSFMPVPCIACGCVLGSVDRFEGNQPYEGTAFMSHGHYGSTYFDSMDGSFIEINVCDSCLRVAQVKSRILIGQSDRLIESTVDETVCIVGSQSIDPPELRVHDGSRFEAERHYCDPADIGTTNLDTDRHKVRWNWTPE